MSDTDTDNHFGHVAYRDGCSFCDEEKKNNPYMKKYVDICPGCAHALNYCVGYCGEEDYEAVMCPNGCDLWELYG